MTRQEQPLNQSPFMATKKMIAAGLGLVSLGLVQFALGGRPHHYAIGVGLCLIGVLVALLGVRFTRPPVCASPEALRQELLALARRRGGEIGELELHAELGFRAPEAELELLAMENEQACRRVMDAEGRSRWLFRAG